MPAIWAPSGTMLHREGEVTKVYAFYTDREISFPITTSKCEVCEHEVALDELVVGSRVNGDSKFGYHAKHRTCKW